MLKRQGGNGDQDSPSAWYYRHRKHLLTGELSDALNSNPSLRGRKTIEPEVTADVSNMFSSSGDSADY
jgi:hypothetical protein